MALEDIKFRFYPSLLNQYDRFLEGTLSENDLLDRINRVPIPQTEAQAKGVSFEDAVLKGVEEELYDAEIIKKVRALLPRPMMKTQVYCEYQWKDVLIYGYVDVIGKMLAADIKTTKQYTADAFAVSHQNLYLPALKSKGIRSLRYVITDFSEVYQEEYDQTVDLSFQLNQIETFCDFLKENRKRVSDLRIFNLHPKKW